MLFRLVLNLHSVLVTKRLRSSRHTGLSSLSCCYFPLRWHNQMQLRTKKIVRTHSRALARDPSSFIKFADHYFFPFAHTHSHASAHPLVHFPLRSAYATFNNVAWDVTPAHHNTSATILIHYSWHNHPLWSRVCPRWSRTLRVCDLANVFPSASSCAAPEGQRTTFNVFSSELAIYLLFELDCIYDNMSTRCP